MQKPKAIVGIHLSPCGSDAESLPAAVEEIERNLGRTPEQIVVDRPGIGPGGHASAFPRRVKCNPRFAVQSIE
jgi:hypothetical protein